MMNNERKNQEKLEESKAYFDKLNLSDKLETLFATDVVKGAIQEAYTNYESKLNGLIENMPAPIKKRANALLEQNNSSSIKEDYFSDVKSNVMYNITRLLKRLEDFVPMDDAVGTLFARAFEDEVDGKMLIFIKEIANGLAEKLLEDFYRIVSVPENIPTEVAALLAVIGGGAPMMNFTEYMEMLENECEEDAPDKKD